MLIKFASGAFKPELLWESFNYKFSFHNTYSVIQIIYFFIIKFFIIEKIENILNNLESLQKTLNCK